VGGIIIIYEIVERLTKENETCDPFKIAEALGALIVYVPLVRVNGFYQRYQDQDIIYINQDLTEEEQILVCAHELGHMVLHNDINSIFLETTLKVNGLYELEANAFAVQLLQEYINLNGELPILNWYADNYAIKRRVVFTVKS
jgi:Zn-dependent peptidase ImmA (M78 family)